MPDKIIDRLYQYIDYKGIPPTRFEKEIGLSNGYLNTQYKRKADLGEGVLGKIIDNCLDLDPAWLVTGSGQMVHKNGVIRDYIDEPPEKKPEGLPLIPVEAMAGTARGASSVLKNDIKERYVIPEFKGKVDFLIRITGSSMYPRYNSGDIVACKKIKQLTFIQWNKPYVLDTTQGAMVKRLIKSNNEAEVICRSDNKDYPDFNIRLDEVHAVALIVGVIRFE